MEGASEILNPYNQWKNPTLKGVAVWGAGASIIASVAVRIFELHRERTIGFTLGAYLMVASFRCAYVKSQVNPEDSGIALMAGMLFAGTGFIAGRLIFNVVAYKGGGWRELVD